MKYTLYAALLSLLAASCHPSPEDGFVLTGALKGVSSGSAKLLLYNDSDRTSKVIDSVVLVNGLFTLKGKAPISTMMTLLLEPGNWSFPIFVENGGLSVQADTTGAAYYDYSAHHRGDKGAVVKNYQVQGSASHAEWRAYQDDPGLKRYDTTIERIGSVIESAKSKDDENAARDKMDSVRKLKSALQREWIARYISAHPASGVGLYLFHDYYQIGRAHV